MNTFIQMLRTSLTAVGLGVLATAGQLGYAATCYVSPTGSDTNPGTTISAPWQTVQHAFNSVQAGDTVEFRAGIYGATRTVAGTLQTSGTSNNNRITFTNYGGEVAVIEGTINVGFYSNQCTSSSTCVAYVTFQGTPSIGAGLVFEGPVYPGGGVVEVMGAHDVTFDHVEIRNGNYHAGFYQYGGYNIKLLDSYIHDNGVPGSNLDQGIYWDETRGGGNLIANCVIERNAAQGIALYSGSSSSEPSQVTIEENTIVDNGHYGISVYGTRNILVNNILANNGAAFHSAQLGIEHGTNHFVDANILWSSTALQQGMYNATGQRVTHSIIRNPLFADPAKHDYHLLAGSPAIGAGNPRYASPLDRDGIKRSSVPEIGAYGYHP